MTSPTLSGQPQSAGDAANAARATAVEPVPVSPLRDGIPIALKPCPFCEKEAGHIERSNPMSKWRHSIDCTSCGMSGPVEATKPDAIAAWNARPSHDALVEALTEAQACLIELTEPKRPLPPAVDVYMRCRQAELKVRAALHKGTAS